MENFAFSIFFVTLRPETSPSNTHEKNLLKSCLIAALLAVTSAGASAASKGWEPVKSEYHDAKSVAKEDEVEIKTASSLIIVTASHPVHIKVFTILGRLVSEETLQPGTSQLAVGAHGVYIVKVGEITCKVAL